MTRPGFHYSLPRLTQEFLESTAMWVIILASIIYIAYVGPAKVFTRQIPKYNESQVYIEKTNKEVARLCDTFHNTWPIPERKTADLIRSKVLEFNLDKLTPANKTCVDEVGPD